MANNVLSWHRALDQGFEPREYKYAAGLVPEGEYDAILDQKIWAKKAIAINCYFTIVTTRQKIQLTVFCKPQTGLYQVPGSVVDFPSCPLGQIYHVHVKANDKGRVVFQKAALTGEIE